MIPNINNLSQQQECEQSEIGEHRSHSLQYTDDENISAEPMVLVEEHSKRLSRLEELQVNCNTRQLQLEKTILEQNALGNKIFEGQEKTNQIMQNYEHTIHQLEAQMSNVVNIKQSCSQQIRSRRNFSPIVKRLHDRNIILKRRNKQLKRLLKHRKLQEKKGTVSLQHSTPNTTSTVPIRERFINMIIRNNAVKPQVFPN